MAGRAAIFDLDGTLVDSRSDLVVSANVARCAVGLEPLPGDMVAGFVGDGLAKLIERLIPAPDLRQAASEEFSRHYAEHCCQQTSVFPGIVPVLKELRRHGWKIGIASNKPDRFTTRIVEGLGLRAHVDAIRGGDGPRKPDPGQLLDLMTVFAVDPGRTWMVGDHHTDIHAAKSAGCRSLWCRWGLGRIGDLVPDAVCAEPAELRSVLIGDAVR